MSALINKKSKIKTKLKLNSERKKNRLIAKIFLLPLPPTFFPTIPPKQMRIAKAAQSNPPCALTLTYTYHKNPPSHVRTLISIHIYTYTYHPGIRMRIGSPGTYGINIENTSARGPTKLLAPLVLNVYTYISRLQGTMARVKKNNGGRSRGERNVYKSEFRFPVAFCLVICRSPRRVPSFFGGFSRACGMGDRVLNSN